MILLDRLVKVERLSVYDGDKSSYVTLTSSLQATRQPLADEKVEMFGGSFGKMFVIFLDVDQDIRGGDRIKDYEGNLYEVMSGGIENRDDGLIADHMKIVCKKIN